MPSSGPGVPPRRGPRPSRRPWLRDGTAVGVVEGGGGEHVGRPLLWSQVPAGDRSGERDLVVDARLLGVPFRRWAFGSIARCSGAGSPTMAVPRPEAPSSDQRVHAAEWVRRVTAMITAAAAAGGAAATAAHAAPSTNWSVSTPKGTMHTRRVCPSGEFEALVSQLTEPLWRGVQRGLNRTRCGLAGDPPAARRRSRSGRFGRPGCRVPVADRGEHG